MTSNKHRNWQDMYYDGLIDGIDDDFCECSQSIAEIRSDFEFKSEEEYWDRLETKDDYYIGFKVKRETIHETA